MRYAEIYDAGVLTEAVDRSLLFHWTNPSKLASIFTQNRLKAAQSSMSNLNGVSFARDPQATFMNDKGVVIVVDGDLLRRKYKLVPRYGDSRHAAAVAAASPEDWAAITPRRESEEFIARDVEPLSQFMTHLVVQNYWWETIMQGISGKGMSPNNAREIREMGQPVVDFIEAHNIKLVTVKDLSDPWVRRL